MWTSLGMFATLSRPTTVPETQDPTTTWIGEAYKDWAAQWVDQYRHFDWMMDQAERRRRGLTEAQWQVEKRNRAISHAWTAMENQDAYEYVWTYMPDTLRPVAELHDNDGGSCGGCDPGDYAESNAYWPCKTWQLVESLAAGP